ncbi:MAG: glycosyltransferase family 4 protein, partial [Candidatus Thermoplasmatota archaeon]
DILHSWNGHCLFQMHRAHDLGMKCIVERASTHIEYQYKLLKEEYKRFNINQEPIEPLVMKKSLLEYGEADYIFVPSEFAYNSFPNELKHKLRLIPYGIDVKKFIPNKKEHDKFTCLFIGDNAIRKGLHYLVQAWSELNLRNAKLIVKAHVELKKDIPNIEVINHVEDITELYSKADVFILPSIEEGRALVVGEALSSGVPVIITPNTGWEIKDGGQGFVTDIRDVKALKEKIQYFYDNPNEIKRMGREARRYVKDCTWQKYQKELIKTYESIGTGGENG